jgi:acyl-CoA reductase-like NAD-dependent aldehyde dehydrogenase/nicotinamidase-related amidase
MSVGTSIGVHDPALLLVDLQEDFLSRGGLVPDAAQLTARAQSLLAGCREQGIPVLHVRTVVRADGSDRMPHWKREDYWACVEGTPGALAPAPLREVEPEAVFQKQFYSAFGAPGLAERLAELGTRSLLIGGVYLHACVRATALDAYERGYDVWILEDAVGSTEPVHAEITRSYLCQRVARFVETEPLLARLRGDAAAAAADDVVPVACIGGSWRAARKHLRMQQRQPSQLSVCIGEVPLAGSTDVIAAAESAAAVQPVWNQRSAEERADGLRRFARCLADREQELALLLVREIGKPRKEALAEVRRAVAHVGAALRLVEGDAGGSAPHSGVRVRHRAIGTVGLITPWNNPVAIPVGKIAPALAFGNAVVWKPSFRAPRSAMAIMMSLLDAGFPPGLVSLVFGEADTARAMIAEASIDAISLTGSIQTGQRAAALCAQYGKPLQAELGGNNAAIVLGDCDMEAAARGLALSAFSFAGQRCTATRRIIVERSVAERFTGALEAAVRGLKVGDPEDPDTEVGPVVSPEDCQRVAAVLQRASSEGGRILCGGTAPAELGRGCYFLPTLVAGLEPRASLVQEETFGPVAVILPANDLDDAIRLANAVPQGLVAELCTRDAAACERFAQAIEAGILKLATGPLAVHPEAPFGGWKASGIGPPEHGIWDREFYARAQAIYGEREEGRA